MEIQPTPEEAERERRRTEILAAVDRSEEFLARGDGRTVTSREGARQLTEDVKHRGLAWLAAEQNAQAGAP